MSFIFNGNETPQEAAKRRQSTLDMLERGVSSQPRNVGEGMSAIAQALAYRRLQGQQPQTVPGAAGADPWNTMRQPSGGMFGGMRKMLGGWGA